jgi:hypothetical protein
MNLLHLHTLAVAAWLVVAAAAQQTPVTATIQLPAELELTSVLAIDIDRDGRSDLALGCHDAAKRQRELRIHVRGKDDVAFTNQPSLPPLPLDRDVIAFTFADLRPAPGRELVLLTAERAVVVERDADGTPSYSAIGDIRLVWPAPDRERVMPLLDACVDLDGDGGDDLLLPEPDGAWLQLQAPAAQHRLRLLAWRSPFAGKGNGAANLQGNRLDLQLQLDDGDDDANGRDRGPLARIRQRAPRVEVLDLDGDGRRELVSVRNGLLMIDNPRGDGVPRNSALPLPLPADRLTLFDPDFDVQLVDVDGDRRLDLLLTTSARRNDEIEVRIDLYRTRADGSWADKPDSRLRLQTMTMPPQLVDADGDGVLDVVAVTVRTDALRALAGDAPVAIEAQLNIFRGTGERFATPALLNQPLQLPPRDDRRRPFLQVLAGRSGEPGQVLLQQDGALLRRPLQKNGVRLQLAEPDRRVPVPEQARIDWIGGNEVLVRSKRELLHVRLP